MGVRHVARVPHAPIPLISTSAPMFPAETKVSAAVLDLSMSSSDRPALPGRMWVGPHGVARLRSPGVFGCPEKHSTLASTGMTTTSLPHTAGTRSHDLRSSPFVLSIQLFITGRQAAEGPASPFRLTFVNSRDFATERIGNPTTHSHACRRTRSGHSSNRAVVRDRVSSSRKDCRRDKAE
jgi:hypothetical protein